MHKNQEKPLFTAVEFTVEMAVHREMNGVLWPFEVPGGAVEKNQPANAGSCKRCKFEP